MKLFTITASTAFIFMLTGTVTAQCDAQQNIASVQNISYSVKGSDDIVDTAINAGSFDTLAAALTADRTGDQARSAAIQQR